MARYEKWWGDDGGAKKLPPQIAHADIMKKITITELPPSDFGDGYTRDWEIKEAWDNLRTRSVRFANSEEKWEGVMTGVENVSNAAGFSRKYQISPNDPIEARTYADSVLKLRPKYGMTEEELATKAIQINNWIEGLFNPKFAPWITLILPLLDDLLAYESAKGQQETKVIEGQVQEKAGYVHVNFGIVMAEYGEYVEYGTASMPAEPFIRPIVFLSRALIEALGGKVLI